jgi:hypothetical protein
MQRSLTFEQKICRISSFTKKTRTPISKTSSERILQNTSASTAGGGVGILQGKLKFVVLIQLFTNARL